MRFDIECIAKNEQKHTQRVHAYTMRRRLDCWPSTSSVHAFKMVSNKPQQSPSNTQLVALSTRTLSSSQDCKCGYLDKAGVSLLNQSTFWMNLLNEWLNDCLVQWFAATYWQFWVYIWSVFTFFPQIISDITIEYFVFKTSKYYFCICNRFTAFLFCIKQNLTQNMMHTFY